MTFFKVLLHLIIFAVLTLFTQIGGIVWLICLPLFHKINNLFHSRSLCFLAKTGVFTGLYLLTTMLVVPPLAKWQCGRVPLPVWNNSHLRPHNVFYYCILNHHYVKPALKAAAENVAEKMAAKYPDAVICYLDANFPFFDGYPLEPHFSHRDGKKLDVALHWKETARAKPIFGTPSRLGYGASEEPKTGEIDFDDQCKKQGNWYRNLERDYLGRFDKEKYSFDEERTRDMIRLFAEEKTVGKILLEPHLKNRLGLGKFEKIRFQGCKAARHDDHIHVQL
ncbi:MAG: hypothetical protein R2830_03580 [Saprospiraceae bacterium]